MHKITAGIIKTSPFLFGLVVYIFFAFSYQYHLHYQEQLQMFLFTTDYFKQLLARPGGLTDYLGTFFTQFFYISWLGAFTIALLLVLLQQQVSVLANQLKKNEYLVPFTFIPSILFWMLMCDENYLLTGLIAAILVLFSVQIYCHLKTPVIRLIGLMFFLPVLYWFAGGAYWVFGVLCLVLEWGYFKNLSKLQWLLAIAGILLFVLISPFVAKSFLQYPMSRLFWGISYYRYPVISPYPLLTIWLSLILIPLIYRFLQVVKNENARLAWISVEFICLILLGTGLVRSVADWNKEEIMAYDYCARTEQWKKMIDIANHKDPNAPLSVACLNLALSKTGIMGDCMFRYYQNGPEGLLPTFQRDFTMPFISGEIYYHLGFLNTSMRYAFEAMEAIPDYKKSSRAIKRMAEINLLNGEVKVASKYLHILQKTLFYSDWATETLRCIDNPKLIDKNPEWAALRKYRITNDFLFSELEKDQMLGLLFTHCTANRMAYEYLMAYSLLTKDLEHVVRYFPLGENLGYGSIPAHYQEALVFIWSNKTGSLNALPWPISNDVKQAFVKYAQLYSSTQNPDPRFFDSYSQTYWYYLHFRK